MKKQPLSVLLLVTAVFAAFTLGLYAGRNSSHEAIQITGISAAARNSVSASSPTIAAAPSTEPVFPLNINTAQAHELAALPGIGDLLAQRIVDYRTANGPFPAPEELLNVEGIGTGKLEAILTLITTGG